MQSADISTTTELRLLPIWSNENLVGFVLNSNFATSDKKKDTKKGLRLVFLNYQFHFMAVASEKQWIIYKYLPHMCTPVGCKTTL